MPEEDDIYINYKIGNIYNKQNTVDTEAKVVSAPKQITVSCESFIRCKRYSWRYCSLLPLLDLSGV